MCLYRFRLYVVRMLTSFNYGISYLFISHDLPMVRYISHRMVVMYLGAVMEEGPALDIYEFPQHPYSKALTKMVGEVVPRAPIGALLKGEPASPLHPPKGCLFSDRCPDVERRCLEERPPLREWADRRIDVGIFNGVNNGTVNRREILRNTIWQLCLIRCLQMPLYPIW